MITREWKRGLRDGEYDATSSALSSAFASFPCLRSHCAASFVAAAATLASRSWSPAESSDARCEIWSHFISAFDSRRRRAWTRTCGWESAWR